MAASVGVRGALAPVRADSLRGRPDHDECG